MKVEFPKVNNKLAFFDFDRTLVAHSHSKEYMKARIDSYVMECVYSLTSLTDEYKADKPLPCMQWYVKKLFDEGYGLYCITHEIFNLRDELKVEELKLFYPDTPMTYLTVDTPEHKIDMIKAVAMVEECDLGDIIFVDDRMETVNLALAAGIDAKHLSDIAALYENNITPWQQDEIIDPNGSLISSDDDSTTSDVTYDHMTEQDCGLSDEELERTVRECRQLVEGRMRLQDKVG